MSSPRLDKENGWMLDFIEELFKCLDLAFRILCLRIWDSGLRILDKFRGVPPLTNKEFEIQNFGQMEGRGGGFRTRVMNLHKSSLMS